jgi:choline kinase
LQAIILAAGAGRRLGSFAQGRPKCLVRIAGRTILERQIHALQIVGVDDFVVVTGYRADLVQAALRSLPVKFVNNPRYHETNVLWSWSLGAEFLVSDHFYLHGDTVFEPRLLERALGGSGAGVVLTVDRHPCGAEEMKVMVNGTRVTAISKVVPNDLASGEFTGVMLVRKRVTGRLRAIGQELLAQERGGGLFVEAALEVLIAEEPHEIAWVDVSDLKWREIDFPGDLSEAETLFSSKAPSE